MMALKTHSHGHVIHAPLTHIMHNAIGLGDRHFTVLCMANSSFANRRVLFNRRKRNAENENVAGTAERQCLNRQSVCRG